jgi:phage-related protein
MATDVSIKLGVTGESDLTSALKGVESRIKNLNSEMKAAVSSMSGLESAEQQAAKKSDILTRSIDATKDKIGILSQQYDKAKAKLDELGAELENARQQFGENSAEALKAEAAYNRQAVTVNNLGTKINNATADMNKMEAELRDLADDADRAGDDMDRLGDDADRAGDDLDRMGDQAGRARRDLDRLGDDADQAGNAFQQLGDKISRQEAELNRLKSAYSSAVLSFGKGSREARDLENQIDRLSTELKQSKTAFRQAADAADDFDNSMDDAGDGAGGLMDKLGGIKGSLVGGAIGGAISGLVQSAVSGIKSLVEETAEYQKIMGVLEVSSQKAGYTAEQTGQSYRQLYAIIGEDQASATALANLQALGLSQSELTTLIDGCIGAWATYGDSVPIDSLAEAVNETIKTGTVTSSFADVLNWAGTSEDEFNKKLEATKDPAERARLVLDELARQGLPQLADAFREANPEVVAMNEAQAQMQDAMAGLGAAFAPVVAGVTEALAGLMAALTPVGEAISTVFLKAFELLQPVIDGLKERFQDVKNAINEAFTPEQQAAISKFFSTLATLVVAAPFAALAAVINIVVTAVELLINVIGALVGFFSETLPSAIQTAVSWIAQLPGKISSFFSTVIANVSAWASEMVSKAVDVGGRFLSSIGNFFGQLPGKIASFLAGALSAITGWASNAIAKAAEAGNGVLSAIGNFFGQIPGKIASLLAGALSALATWAANMAAKARAGMNNVRNAIVSTLQSIPGRVASVGRNIVQGLWNGIQGAAGWLLGRIKGWCSNILNGIKGFFGIHSPSRVMRDEVGVQLAKGMALGIRDGESYVIRAEKSQAAKVVAVAAGAADEVEDTWKETNQRLLDDTAKRLNVSVDTYKKSYNQVVDLTSELNNRLVAKEEELTKRLEDTGLDEATKEALNSQLSAVKDFRTEYEAALSEIEKAQESMADKLRDYGELFQSVKDETGEFLELSDLQEQIDGIQRYGDALDSLKNRGVSDSLLDEIIGMDVDKATAYTEKLLSMTDEEYSDYIALWEKKQAEAQAVAQKFYADELQLLGYEFVDKLPGELDGMKQEMRDLGIQSIQGLIDGMNNRSGALYATAQRIVSSAIAAMRAAADIHSPSRVTRNMVGKPLAQGIGAGFMAEMERINRQIADTVLSPFETLSRGDLMDAAAGVVNGNAGLAMAGAGGAQTVVIPVNLNGKQIAEVVYDPLKQVGRQRGQY